ncbi:hypothetical protein [Paenibacillus massiliensis]|uniref:hypothetical protein n=1 Tax=Paenibacillus massiliensis TaxID=225917 RepID=UPI00047195A3|nr:hypothetical protein [Paenibacillus massiliensis]
MTDQEQLATLLEQYTGLSQRTIAEIRDMDEDQLLDFVEQREALVKQMEPFQSLVTTAMKSQIRQLLQDETVIVDRMQEIKDEAAEWLKKRSSIRSQQSAYQSSFSVDGVFIDYRN